MPYWTLILGYVAVSVGFSIGIGRWLIRETQEYLDADYQWIEGDIKWTRNSVIFVSLMSLVAGVGAGLLGIGGGLVLNPFMLTLGVDPQVSAATSSFIILSTSGIALLQFGLSHLLNVEYALW
jgi:uncharacterized membrane protein YfcA